VKDEDVVAIGAVRFLLKGEGASIFPEGEGVSQRELPVEISGTLKI
jgi:hypothetical protein